MAPKPERNSTFAEELRRIASIEDDEDIRTVIDLTLSTIGEFEVRSFDSGVNAIARISEFVEFDPQLILMDVMMPVMDGVQTALRLQSYARLRETPVVYMTAKAALSEIEKLYDQGAASVISKPFDPMTLSGQLRAIWERRASLLE